MKNRNTINAVNVFLSLICLSISFVIIIPYIKKSIEFKQNCSSYLKGAADANSVDLALDRIQPAIEYLEAKNKTSGYSHFLIRTESSNIGFWYKNLVSARNNLIKASENSEMALLEESNVLMKLRETILDESQGASLVTVPSNIVLFPNVKLGYLLIFAGFFIFCVGAFNFFMIVFKESYEQKFLSTIGTLIAFFVYLLVFGIL